MAVGAAPSEAEACGGTFCDAGQPMPVDQTGENIIFVMGEAFTEAHIQIQYDPEADADEFAWVIPLMVVPEFEVGSQPLFDNVLAGTVPSYGFVNQFTGEDCGGSGGDTTGGFPGGTTAADDGGSTGDGGGPEIILQEIVGAFEITVLSGGTVDELVVWLDDNGYAQDPASEPILGEYLAEGYLFAAFKLVNDSETSDIHPIVLRFPIEEACVPLRLTRIAAIDDMDIRTFFLADSRVVPRNYRHVLVNPLKLDWPNRASNYKQVITLAVDADEANGRAFVTEYAASSSVVSQFGIYSELWDALSFEGDTALEAINRLKEQQLLNCFYDEFEGVDVCDFAHPLLRALTQQYMPTPDGLTETEFLGCPECYEGLIDEAAWDGVAFAALLDERIIAPGAHAVSLLDAYPTLTRMYTTISPGEMTEDPFFDPNPDLPLIDLRNQRATRRFGCGPDEIWELPDGREVYVPGGNWPSFDMEMPWEEEVQEIAPKGGPIVLTNRTELIDTELFEHNCQYNYPSPEVCGNPPGGTGGTGGTGGGGTSGGSGTDGADGGADGADGGGEGCGCRSDAPAGGGAVLLGLGLLGLGRRRRR